ncbi:MAG: hypothetical protein LLH30_03580 [Candidatus Manganitrophus sp. SA1]|nr:hypothetical protein [Candidatus Manganitrophus morganii]
MYRGFIVLFYALFLAIGIYSGAPEASAASGGRSLPPEPGVGEDQGEETTPRLTFHGYGEIHYNNPETGSTVPDGDAPAQMDSHRLVLGWSYAFSDWIQLHAEVDFEHAAQEMELEFAYLDFLIHPAFNVRGGVVLMPVGPLNEFHEPTLFYSVERPYVQAYIIPTTWQEGGAGIFGEPLPGLNYRVYLVSSLNAEGFTARTGLRSGRGKAAEAPSDDLAVVGRLEYVGIPGLDVGLSAYQGGANATNNPALGDASVGIWEGDVRVRMAGADLRAVYVQVNVDDADNISTVTSQTIGEEMIGWYVEGAYHFLRLIAPRSPYDAVVFVRWEAFNTQEQVPSGLTADPTNDRQVLTYGLAYYPDPQVAVKIDREVWEDEADNDGSRFNVGLAFMF